VYIVLSATAKVNNVVKYSLVQLFKNNLI